MQDGAAEFEDRDVKWGMDLGSEHERYLCEEHYGKPTIVINYPAAIKVSFERVDIDFRRSTCA